MQNAPPVVRQHQKHVQDLEPDREHRKEVDRNHGLHVGVQEGPQGLGGRPAAAHQVLAHAGVDTKLKQFAMNARSTPQWVLAAHGANQRAHLPEVRSAGPAYRGGPSTPRTDESLSGASR